MGWSEFPLNKFSITNVCRKVCQKLHFRSPEECSNQLLIDRKFAFFFQLRRGKMYPYRHFFFYFLYSTVQVFRPNLITPLETLEADFQVRNLKQCLSLVKTRWSKSTIPTHNNYWNTRTTKWYRNLGIIQKKKKKTLTMLYLLLL